MAGLDDLFSWLFNDPTQGGMSQMGKWLGVGSPTASTQSPVTLPAGGTRPPITLGGAPPAQSGGILGGLLGGQQPVNPMNYFQPRPGLLGDSPLGNMLRGGLAGLSAGAGQGGLTGLGTAAMGGMQADQQRRAQEMQRLAAGQQYQAGQAQMASTNMQIAEALRQYNIMNDINNKTYGTNNPDLTYADLMNDPQKLSQIMTASGNAAVANITGWTPGGTATAPAGTTTVPTLSGGTINIPSVAHTLPSGSPGPTTPAQQITIPSGATMDQTRQAIASIEGTTPDKISGAVGGLTPDTFDLYNKKYFGGQLNFANEADRAKVSDQLYADLEKASTDPNTGQIDPARVAVGYFSGEGNIAPFGSPLPYKYSSSDAHGTTIPRYLGQFATNLQNLQGQAGAGGGTTAGQSAAFAAPGQDQLTAAFQQLHPGYTPAQWEQLGRALGGQQGQQMIAEAQKYDYGLIHGTAVAQAVPSPARPGSISTDPITGQTVGHGTPMQTTFNDPATGNAVSGFVWPDGSWQILGQPVHWATTGGGTTTAPSGGAAGGTSAGGGPPPTGTSAAATQLQTQWAKQYGDWGASQKPSYVAMQQLQQMATALSKTTTGEYTTDKAGYIGLIKAIPGLEGLAADLEKTTGIDSSRVQEALRLRFAAVAGQILPNLSVPAQQQLEQAINSLASPNLTPEANRAILGQVIGTIQWDRAMYRDLSDPKSAQSYPKNPQQDLPALMSNWADAHPLDDFVKKATDALPAMKGADPVASAVQKIQTEHPELKGVQMTGDGHIAGLDANGVVVDPVLHQKYVKGRWVDM